MTDHDAWENDGYFLSPVNSGATRDQRALEALALDIMATPVVAAARQQTRFMWKAIIGRDGSDEAWARFEAFLEEYAFNAALKAANGDADRPRVLSSIYGPPHEWFGMRVPGSRLAGDNPDNHYSLIPIDADGHFELSGRRLEPAPGDINFTVMGNTGLNKTLASLQGRDLHVDADGRFVVTIGPAPAGGRPNHLQTKRGALYLFIRESKSDWRQRPARLRVRRLDPVETPPPSLDERAARAAEIMVEDVPGAYWWMRLCLALTPNEMAQPFKTAAVGGLYSQQVSFGHLLIEDDEAFVITVDAGGAGFRNLVLHDYWYVSIDVENCTSCLNSGQAAADWDGRFTYVVSHDDPGIHNWLDPAGLHEVMLVHRWQDLPQVSTTGEPAIHGRLVKFADLATVLPGGVQKMNGAERQRQLVDRAAQFRLRFAEV